MRSSSSWAPERSFADFLGSSLAILRGEQPAAYLAMSGALGDSTLDLEVGGERVGLLGAASEVRLGPSGHGGALVRSDRHTVLALIDGEVTLMEAIETDRIFLRGPLDELLRFHDALLWYLQGAVRARSMPPLLERYRSLDGEGPR